MSKTPRKDKERELSIVIPTYNESENIGLLISEIEKVFRNYGIDGEILVVDDNSPDGTADVVRKYMEMFDNVRILERKVKNGLGYAYKEGFKAVRGRIIMEMDADFSHAPQDVPYMFRECLSGFDIVVGSRYVRNGRIIGWDFARRMVSFVANMLVNILLRLGVKDNTSGFRAYRREALEEILPHVRCNSYDFQVEMLQRAKEHNLTVKEIPIVFRERAYGKSKLGRREFSSFIKMLLKETLHKNSKSQ